MLRFTHNGAVRGVTGSCHRLTLPDGQAVLVDCGLFQGAETSPDGASVSLLELDFPLDKVRALVVTHVHIDYVGRVPYLLAAGFRGPIYCIQTSAQLLPLVLEDALEVGFTRNRSLIAKFLALLKDRTVPLPYKRWQTVVAAALGCRCGCSRPATSWNRPMSSSTPARLGNPHSAWCSRATWVHLHSAAAGAPAADATRHRAGACL